MIKRIAPFILCALLMAPAQMAFATPEPEPAPALTAAQKAKAAREKAKKKEDRKKYARNKLDLFQIHHFTMWGGAGYSGLVNKTDYSKFIGGGGGMVGIGYEWHYKKFQLAIGPEFRMFSSQDNMNFLDGNNQPQPFSVSGTGLSADGSGYATSMTKYYDFQKFHETQAIGQVMLPITFGAQFDGRVPIYFMVGAKVGYTLISSWSHRSNLTTYVRDKDAQDDWYDIPAHDLQTRQYTNKGKGCFTQNLPIDAVITAEVGVKLNDFFSEEWNKKNDAQKYPWHLRAALFLDYGLPMISAAKNDAVEVVVPEQETVSTNSLHMSKYAPTSKLNSLLVGAKFTALLQLNRPKKMKPQNPYLVVQLLDAWTHKPINNSGVVMETRNLSTNKLSKKGPNSKGLSVQRMVPDDYSVYVRKAGYLPVDTAYVTLVEGENNNLKQRLDTTYFYLYPEPVFTCNVVDEKTGERIPATLEFYSNDVNKIQNTLRQDPANENPMSLKLEVGKFYMVSISAENYLSQQFVIGEQGLQSMTAQYALTPVERGKTFIIQNLFFVYAKTEILPESDASLTELYDFLNENQGVRIRITGHTDWVGSDEDNQVLSEGRANAVRDYMIDRGIDPSRIEAEGKGESEPIDTNETEEGRQHNRRVEFTIL